MAERSLRILSPILSEAAPIILVSPTDRRKLAAYRTTRIAPRRETYPMSTGVDPRMLPEMLSVMLASSWGPISDSTVAARAQSIPAYRARLSLPM